MLRTFSFYEIEVRTNEGQEFIRRIIPYRTADNIIDGLVLTFVDIHQIRDAERAGERARVYFESIVNTVREPLLEKVLPHDSVFEDYEVEVELPKLGRRSFVLNARRMKQLEGSGDLILLALEDMTTP